MGRMPTRVLPALDELLGQMSVVTIPLHARFRGVTHREAVLLDGPAGWGEFAPFLEYEPREAAGWLAAAVEAAWVGWPDPVREVVPVNATVPAVAAGEVAGVVARFDGCRTAKVKVAERGQSLDDDLARVAEVRRVMGPDARVRVDANGGWSVDDALWALDALSRHGLEYAEQPCATVEELADLRVALARNVIKVAPLGGVRAALGVVEACGLPAVVSSALDTSVGIRAGVALAAALPSLEHACGLGTVALLDGDVAAAPLVPRGGALGIRPVEVSRNRLEALAAPPDRVRWWRERVAACHAELASSSGSIGA